MKKRLIAVTLVIAMAMASLLACSSKDDAETASSDTKAKKEETKKETTKVILNEVAHSIFYAPMYVAIEEGYFADEGIDLDLVTGFGADKTMTAVLSGSADIGFMGSEASIYTYNEGANDYVVNFAQLTQRAGNFLVAREEMPDFTWEDIKGKKVLGGRKGGMPEMVFEYILNQNNIDPATLAPQSISRETPVAVGISGARGARSTPLLFPTRTCPPTSTAPVLPQDTKAEASLLLTIRSAFTREESFFF